MTSLNKSTTIKKPAKSELLKLAMSEIKTARDTLSELTNAAEALGFSGLEEKIDNANRNLFHAMEYLEMK